MFGLLGVCQRHQVTAGFGGGLSAALELDPVPARKVVAVGFGKFRRELSEGPSLFFFPDARFGDLPEEEGDLLLNFPVSHDGADPELNDDKARKAHEKTDCSAEDDRIHDDSRKRGIGVIR